MTTSFASDNNAPVALEILRALEAANTGDAVGYGDDAWTARAIERLREEFGDRSDAFFAFNGTGANIMALSTVLRPYEAVICPFSAHLNVDECGALERFAGCKTIALPTADGKLRPADVAPYAVRNRDVHHPLPRVLSISQATEYGTLYTPAEVRALADFAHERGLLLHVDGARISNAAAALGMGLRQCTRDLGVDILTFGGTKNGLMYGEAAILFDLGQYGEMAGFAQKQTTQLASKMRYIAAQFEALLEGERWRTYAAHANAMAARLAQRVRSIAGVTITRPVEVNAIFATLDDAAAARLQREFFFHVFSGEARWMTHHATTAAQVDAFADALERCAG